MAVIVDNQDEACLIHWVLIHGEYWTAQVQKGVRCTDVFHKATTTTELRCFRNCLTTSRCCSVNYDEDQNLCEFCTAGPTVTLMKHISYRYIGFTIYQEKRGNDYHTNHHPCYACAEIFDGTESTVNTTDVGKFKSFKCKNNTKSDTEMTEARCEYKMNSWSSTTFNCLKRTSCYSKKEDFNEPFSTLTNGGTCLSWGDPNALLNYFPDSYFTADGKSRVTAQNYCRHPTLEGTALYYHSAAYPYCNTADPLIEKAMCAVLSCDSTSLEQCGIPPSLPSPAERSFPVVGDVFLANYKCSSLSGNSPTPHCPVSRCVGGNNWTTPSISCTSKDCYPAGQHTSYGGKRSCTESGRTCQAWASHSPHAHGYTTLASNMSNSNYCRGTSNLRPWCYTMDKDMRWEICNVPEC